MKRRAATRALRQTTTTKRSRNGAAKALPVKNRKMQQNAAVRDGDGDSDGDHRYWLFKSEPNTRMSGGVDVKFGIDDLIKEKNQTTHWDGVRNHQAKNFMRV